MGGAGREPRIPHQALAVHSQNQTRSSLRSGGAQAHRGAEEPADQAAKMIELMLLGCTPLCSRLYTRSHFRYRFLFGAHIFVCIPFSSAHVVSAYFTVQSSDDGCDITVPKA